RIARNAAAIDAAADDEDVVDGKFAHLCTLMSLTGPTFRPLPQPLWKYFEPITNVKRNHPERGCEIATILRNPAMPRARVLGSMLSSCGSCPKNETNVICTT